MSDHNGGRWINDEQYIAPYDVVMELNNIKTIAYHLGEDKRELLEANTKLVGAINLIRETLNGGEVQDLHQIINSALAAHAATTVTHNAELRGAKPIGEASLSNDVLGADAPERN